MFYSLRVFSCCFFFKELVGWFVVLGLASLCDSISVYIGPSPKEREKEERKDRVKTSNNAHPHLLQAQ